MQFLAVSPQSLTHFLVAYHLTDWLSWKPMKWRMDLMLPVIRSLRLSHLTLAQVMVMADHHLSCCRRQNGWFTEDVAHRLLAMKAA
jgi:hypothetical protein